MSGGSETQVPSSPGDPLAPPGAPGVPAGTGGRLGAQDAPAPRVAAYRSEHRRARSVYRRANPWYRRLARGVVAVCFLAAGGAALYFGARELQDYLDRDRLPAAGVEIPAISSTTFQIAATAPAPALDGTLEIDVDTGAFRFVGSSGGAQAGAQAVSIDGTRVLLQNGGGWTEAAADDPLAAALSQAIPFLVGVDSADDVLVNRMRNGYVELIDKTTEGVGDLARERYEMQFDYADYAIDQPLQWQAFQQKVVPGITELADASLTIWLDTDGVLVRMRDPQTNWTWERLSYADAGFDPDPTGEIAAAVGS